MRKRFLVNETLRQMHLLSTLPRAGPIGEILRARKISPIRDRRLARRTIPERVVSKARDHGHWQPRSDTRNASGAQIASLAALPFVRSASL